MSRRWRRLARRDDGMTLVELLISMVLSGVIISALFAGLLVVLKTAVGLDNATAGSGEQDSDLIAAQLEASEGMQRLSRFFTADVENATRRSHVDLSDQGLPCTAPAPTLLLSATDHQHLTTLQQRDRTGAIRLVQYRYSRDDGRNLGQITRFQCVGDNLAAAEADTAEATVVAAGLSTAVVPTVGSSGTEWLAYRLVATTVIGRAYTFTATHRVDLEAPAATAGPSPSASASASPTPPPVPQPLDDLALYDKNRDGKVDAIVAKFRGAAPPTSCRNGWSISGAHPGITLDSVTLTDDGGPGIELILSATNNSDHSINTSVGTTSVSFVPQADCNLIELTAIAPRDAASPVLHKVTQALQNGQNYKSGRMDTGDALTLEFTEPIDPDSVPQADVTVTETHADGSDTLTIPGITQGAIALGDTNYVTSGSSSWSAGLTPSPSTDGSRTVTVTLKSCLPQTDCSTAARGKGAFTFIPSTDLKDAAGNSATTLLVDPAPVASNWEMF